MHLTKWAPEPSLYFKDQGHPVDLGLEVSQIECIWNLLFLEVFSPIKVILFHMEPSHDGEKRDFDQMVQVTGPRLLAMP